MSGTPARPRKRDKFMEKLSLNRHSSSISSPVSNAGAKDTIPPTPHLVQPPLSPSGSSKPTLASTIVPVIDSAPTQTHALVSSSATQRATSRDLWLEALHNLSQEDQQEIGKITPTVEPLSKRMDDLIRETKKKQQDCEKNSYKFRFQGKDIILRDVAEKIVFWLNKFKEVGDVAVNFDPIHAALPWACVRFLLQAAVAGHEQMAALLLITENVSYLIDRCTVYEILYKPGITSGDVLENLHAGLIELYATILTAMALSHRQFNKNLAVRSMHAILNPTELSSLLSTLQNLETRVEIEAQNCERQRSQEADSETHQLLEKLDKPIIRTDERVFSILEKLTTKESIEILDWISNVKYTAHHVTVKDKRTKDTCDWLLEHQHYQQWYHEISSMILWLQGTAGTGKTYLTSRVIDNIQDTLSSNTNHEGLAFFYCNRNESERQNPLSVLRSFVRQLSTITSANDAMQQHIKQFYTQSRIKGSEPTMNECKELLLECINIYPKTTLILDALDECEKEKRIELIDIFDEFMIHATKPVKIFISSRPDGDIKERFKDRANIQIHATDNHGDISKFVQNEITKHRRWSKMPPELQSQIIETIQNRSQGMFQWAFLQIKQLLNLSQAKHIQERLGKLPKDLKDTYDEICHRMSETERQIAFRAFRWVMCSRKPLPTKILLPAVCQDEESNTVNPVDDLDEELLLECCHNLLVIDPQRHVWVPSHLSVIEYFENHYWTQVQAHCLVSTVCLLLLTDKTLNDERTDREKTDWEKIDSDTSSERGSVENEPSDNMEYHDLMVYAANYWMIHIRRCEDENFPQLSELLKRFLGSPEESSPEYRNWHIGFLKSRRLILDPSLYHGSIHAQKIAPSSVTSLAICAFGFYTILSDWWFKPWKNCALLSESGQSHLQLAVLAGSASICKNLLAWGAEINIQLQGYYGSALAAAAWSGEIEVINVLLEAGADVNMQLQGEYGSALAAATWAGRIDIIKILLDAGAEVNTQLQGDCGNALVAAIWAGEIETIKVLIEARADVNMQLQDRFGSALAAAAWRGKIEAIMILLEAGADVNMQLQGRFGSALRAAKFSKGWKRKHEKQAAVQLLLSYGAEDVTTPNVTGESGDTSSEDNWTDDNGSEDDGSDVE